MSDAETRETALLRQQDALAKFGELALRSEDLDEILTEACRLVGDALGTDLAKVLEMQDDGLTLKVRAGVGWKAGVVGEVTVKAEKGSSEGYALETGSPVTSDNIDEETRFKYADFLYDNGVKALVNVAIRGSAGQPPFGILQVDSRTPQQFGDRDTSFLRGYANLLGAAVDRIRVSEQLRRTQAALQARDAMLSQSNKVEAIGQLTGGVAHDFNNLLTIIRSSVDFLRRSDLSDHRRARYIKAIADTVDRAAKLTGQLLAFARRQALKPEVFDVGHQVRTIIDLLSSLLGSRITVEQELCHPPCYAQADVSQFETAVVNLAVNARDAMNGEGRMTFRVDVVSGIPALRGHAPVPGDFIAVSVIDGGSGIEPSQIDKIFEPFFTTKEVGKGTGLGLSQVIGFAKQSGGDVNVQSAAGQGAVFTIYLPHSAPGQELPKAITSQPESEYRRDVGCILVVEDNQVVGKFATETLQDLGYETIWAACAKDALELLASDASQFDLVFSDVIMPGMNGIELAETIRKAYPRLPVVLTSGYSDVLAEEGRHGFELIQKPYSVEVLSHILRNIMGQRTSA
ncbi:MAG: ATP-binding protein [Caulobacteraceae bacterium]